MQRQTNLDANIQMALAGGRISPLGETRYFSRLWFFDGFFGAEEPEPVAAGITADLESGRLSKPSAARLGGLIRFGSLSWLTGVVFVEDKAHPSKSSLITSSSTSTQHTLTHSDINPKKENETLIKNEQEDRDGEDEEVIGGASQTSSRWGYYTEPSQIEQLLIALDNRGIRERELLASLMEMKEAIVHAMQLRKDAIQKSMDASSSGGRRRSRGKQGADVGPLYLQYKNMDV